MESKVIRHYDLLIDENNDPVHDPQPLREYMDLWDGAVFLELLQLDESKSVLEIGVGTGRLAVRTASLCGQFCGIDISPKTIERAKENLSHLRNVRLLLGDFMAEELDAGFDVIYSSLTFMHIRQKQRAVDKISGLLNKDGRFVLSIDKNQAPFIDMGTRKLEVFPDTPEEMSRCIQSAGLKLVCQIETELAYIFAALKI